MAVDGWLHINIRCADVEATRHFYVRALGLTVGARPPFESTGYWLYLDGRPILHIVQRKAEETVHDGAGSLDHVAFHGVDFDATRASLRAAGITFREVAASINGSPQIFVHDPNGIKIEIEFDRTA